MAKRENVGCCMVRDVRESSMHLCNIYICVHARGGGEEIEKEVRCRATDWEEIFFSLNSSHLFEREFWSLICFLCTTSTEKFTSLCYLCGWSCNNWKRCNISRLFGLLLCWGSLWSLWSLLLLCEQEYILNMFVYILGSLFWYVHLGIFGIWASVLNTL